MFFHAQFFNMDISVDIAHTSFRFDTNILHFTKRFKLADLLPNTLYRKYIKFALKKGMGGVRPPPPPFFFFLRHCSKYVTYLDFEICQFSRADVESPRPPVNLPMGVLSPPPPPAPKPLPQGRLPARPPKSGPRCALRPLTTRGRFRFVSASSAHVAV